MPVELTIPFVSRNCCIHFLLTSPSCIVWIHCGLEIVPLRCRRQVQYVSLWRKRKKILLFNWSYFILLLTRHVNVAQTSEGLQGCVSPCVVEQCGKPVKGSCQQKADSVRNGRKGFSVCTVVWEKHHCLKSPKENYMTWAGAQQCWQQIVTTESVLQFESIKHCQWRFCYCVVHLPHRLLYFSQNCLSYTMECITICVCHRTNSLNN